MRGSEAALWVRELGGGRVRLLDTYQPDLFLEPSVEPERLMYLLEEKDDLPSVTVERRVSSIKDMSVATVLRVKVAAVAYSDWGAKTAGVSDVDPMEDILSSEDYILGKGYRPDFIAMHPTLWHKFALNTRVAGYVDKGIMSFAPNGASFQMPGYPKTSVIVDPALTETPTATLGPIIGSSQAPGLSPGPGPHRSSQIRQPAGGLRVLRHPPMAAAQSGSRRRARHDLHLAGSGESPGHRRRGADGGITKKLEHGRGKPYPLRTRSLGVTSPPFLRSWAPLDEPTKTTSRFLLIDPSGSQDNNTITGE